MVDKDDVIKILTFIFAFIVIFIFMVLIALGMDMLLGRFNKDKLCGKRCKYSVSPWRRQHPLHWYWYRWRPLRYEVGGRYYPWYYPKYYNNAYYQHKPHTRRFNYFH